MGNDWNDTPPPERERNSVSVHALVTPTTGEAFEAWAAHRGLTVSAAVRGLILDALWRERRREPLGVLPGDLPAAVAREIVTDLKVGPVPPEA